MFVVWCLKKLKQKYAMSPPEREEETYAQKMPKYIGHDMAFGRLTKCETDKSGRKRPAAIQAEDHL